MVQTVSHSEADIQQMYELLLELENSMKYTKQLQEEVFHQLSTNDTTVSLWFSKLEFIRNLSMKAVGNHLGAVFTVKTKQFLTKAAPT